MIGQTQRRQQRIARGAVFSLQPRQRVLLARRHQMEKTTAATQRCQQPSRLLASEEEPDVFRWFFQRFQQRVGGGFGQQRGIRYPHHLCPTQARMFIQFFAHLAYRVDT